MSLVTSPESERQRCAEGAHDHDGSRRDAWLIIGTPARHTTEVVDSAWAQVDHDE